MMLTYGCYNQQVVPRCRIPLIEICDTTTTITLDLGGCAPCAVGDVVLRLTQAGCPQYETVCETVQVCGCCGDDTVTVPKQVEIPKAAVDYPIHEVLPTGESVFMLDSTLHELGYGRYRAEVLTANHTPTGIIFDVEYTGSKAKLQSISTTNGLPDMEHC